MFSNPNTLIYVQRSSLMLAGKHISSSRLAFPDELVHNLEVVHRQKFISLVDQFLRDHGVHGRRVLIVLDGSVLFHKVIELDKTGQPDILQQAFIDAIPFEPGQRACLAVQSATALRLFATNSDLYSAIAEALHTSGAGKLIAITPSSVYALKNDNRSITAATECFFADPSASKLADFRSVTAT